MLRPRAAARTSGDRPCRHRALVFLATTALLVAFSPQALPPTAAPAVQAAKVAPAAAAASTFANLPARFEPNVGQTSGGIAYVAMTKNYRASMTSDAVHFAFADAVGAEPAEGPESLDELRGQEVRRSVVSMSFVGANPNPEIVAHDLQEGVSNYFLGDDPAAWRTGVPGYSKIEYRELWPGIDLVFYDKSGQIEYDFVVAPGANPSRIALAFDGDEGIRIGDTGGLVVSAPTGELEHSAPVAYQMTGETRSEVDVRFGLWNRGVSGLATAAYDPARPLIIDPTLSYSSYLGAGPITVGYGIAADSDGNAYLTGFTASTGFPTVSPFQPANAGSPDAFVTKVNPAGTALVYSSYLGGSLADFGRDIAVDSDDNAYVTGYTYSTDFPTASPIQPANAGGGDAFVTKINASGSALPYSTYLGGSADDFGRGIAVDGGPSAYVGGYTDSTDFPTVSPFQAANAGSKDAFVSKVDSIGSALVYSSYLGGSLDDFGTGLDVDASGSAYVGGYTDSTDFPTASPFQAANAGSKDAFVSKVDSIGSALVYSSYLGGSADDFGTSIDVSGSGSAYQSGYTDSGDFPTVFPFQATYGGSTDAFVSKVNSAGSALAYSSYLGGTDSDFGLGIGVDASESAAVGGYTYSIDFPTAAPFQAANAGPPDVFVSKVGASGSVLAYSSYLGGTALDYGNALAVDSAGSAFVTGDTISMDFPTVTPFQPVNVGGHNAFVSKVSDVATISGTFAGGQFGSISVYSKADGDLTSYTCCIADPGGAWSVDVPSSSCGAGGGYAVLFVPGTSAGQSRWYDLKDNFGSADCVSAPSSGNDMTIPAASVISGYVKDATTAADIDGAAVYAFKTDGTYAGYAMTGGAGAGRYEFTLSSSESYKLLVNPGAGHVGQWHSGAPNFTTATPTAPPATANFSVTPAGVIDGYVKDASTAADLNGYPVYAYTTAGQFFGYGVTDRGYGPGRYRIQVDPGEPYKLVSQGGPYTKQWYSGASAFTAATSTAAPFTANFSMS